MYFDYDRIPDTDTREFSKDDRMDRIFPQYWYTDEIKDDVLNPDTTDFQEIIGFSGSHNWDDQDMFNVLFTCDNRELCKQYVHERNGYGIVGAISNILKLNYNYVNTLFCIANEYGLVEYGTNLQYGWTTDKAKKVIIRRESNLERIRKLNDQT